jgi:16S rRNA (guanine966-N2)-methyltransferase
MRVIAGRLKGRRLASPTWEGLRPTSDQLRETLFNILGARVAGARVLDGYAGTGALGIEALSRGASHVTFVERDRRAQALLARNLAACGIEGGYAMMRSGFAHALDELRAQAAERAGGAGAQAPAESVGSTSPAGPFDIVLLDPPYEQRPPARAAGKTAESLAAVLAATGEVIASHGIVVLEHARRSSAPEAAGRLVRTRQVTAGDSALTFYACRP